MGWGGVPNWLNSWLGMSGGLGAEHRLRIDGHCISARVIQTPDGLYLKVASLSCDGFTIDAAHVALEPSAAADGGWELAELAEEEPAPVPIASPPAGGASSSEPAAPLVTAAAALVEVEGTPGPDEAKLAELLAAQRWPAEHLHSAFEAGTIDAVAAVEVLAGRRGWCAESTIYVKGKAARSVSAYAVLHAPAQGVLEPCWTRRSAVFRRWVAPAGTAQPVLTGRIQFDRDAIGRALGSVGELHAYFAGAGCATPPSSA